MSADEVGGYIRLLCNQWVNGSVPDDDKKLRMLTHSSAKAIKVIRNRFQKGDDGKLRNRRMEEVRAERVRFIQDCSDAGKRSVEARAKVKVGSTNLPRLVQPTYQPTYQPDGQGTPQGTPQPKVNSSSSSSSSSNTKDREAAPPPVVLVEKKPPPLPPESVPIPPLLDTETFRQHWSDWIIDRKERGKKMTARAAKEQLTKLQEIGHDRAITAIKHSIASGYTGVFEPTTNSNRAAGSSPGRVDAKPGKYAGLGVRIDTNQLRLADEGGTGTGGF